jgi:hypothetical protein
VAPSLSIQTLSERKKLIILKLSSFSNHKYLYASKTQTQETIGEFRTVTMARLLFAALSTRGLGFDPRPVHAVYVVNKVALGKALSEYFDFHLSI